MVSDPQDGGHDGMRKIKFIIFFELIAMFIVGVVHAAALVLRMEFPLTIYPAMFFILLFAVLLAAYIVAPIADKFLN